MKSPAPLLIFLISLMLCLASGCTAITEAMGSVVGTVSPSPSSGPDLTFSGATVGETPDPGVTDTVSTVTTETTKLTPATTTPPQVTTLMTTVTTPATTVTTSVTTATTPTATVTTPATTVTTPATTVTTPTPDITTPDTTVTTPTTTVTTPPATIPTPMEGDIPGAVELVVFRLTNEERAARGVSPLAWDGALAAIARSHSTDMADHHFFSHTNLQGEGPTERAERMGYPTRKELGGGWYSEGIGENINQMPTGNVVDYGYVNNDAESVGRAAVKAFMDSPGHRALILKGEFSNIGVGVAYDGTYYYTTQNFW